MQKRKVYDINIDWAVKKKVNKNIYKIAGMIRHFVSLLYWWFCSLGPVNARIYNVLKGLAKNKEKTIKKIPIYLQF